MPSSPLKKAFNATPAQEEIDAFVTSAHEGRLPEVAAFLDRFPAAVDAKNGCTQQAIILAAIGGHDPVIELLLARGSDINIKDGSNTWTPLMAAAWNGNISTVALLLQKSAEVNETDNQGRTALMNAAWCEYPVVAELLLRGGARLDDKDNEGKTALTLALKDRTRGPGSGQAKVVSLLESWPEMQKAELAAEIASFSPVLRRSMPSPAKLRKIKTG